jgi:GrpB-like predicted nucleotidyltransferase (UPF0157 family)/predicted GNAT family acetyltransferase
MSKYTFKPYQIFFPQLFQQEKARIASLMNHILKIEHIGSTAIPNLGGKGIIDIAIAIRKEDMESATKELQDLGYEFRPAFSTTDRFYFVTELPDPEEGKRRYHVHLTYPENREWKRFIEFRDYLRAHPEAVAEYAEMKKQAAIEANQVGAHYRKAKEPFLEKIHAILNHSIEGFDESNLPEALSFLRRNENFSLFLLGNYEIHGPKLTAAPNSGNFKLIRSDGKIVTVFCLTRRGNLVVQSTSTEEWVLEKILDGCLEERLPILGLLGEWDFCQHLWALLKKRGIIHHETFISKEILYTVDINQQNLSGDPHVRLLGAEDYSQWKLLCIDYLKEEGLSNDLSEEQLHEHFLEKVAEKISWGYFLEQKLVAKAELNAKSMDLGQVGGVYTTPVHRRKGFGQSVMHQLIKDAKDLHQMRKLIIFTGETNHPARKLYESLEHHHGGYYALMFGQSLQVRLISSQKERKEALEFRQKQFFDRIGIQDPYGWTLDHKDHLHWLLYAGEKVVGYAHVQIWPEHRAALRIIVIDEQLRRQGMGKYLMNCCEKLLKNQGIRLLQTEASPNSYPFYQRLGYVEMPFNNPDGEPTHPNDRAMGKFL